MPGGRVRDGSASLGHDIGHCSKQKASIRMVSSAFSTYTSYLVLNRDINSSLSRVASQGDVASNTDYYEENIGKVTTAEEFVNDYRLFSYAMKAYGLEEMTYAKAFMKKVLESDPNDDSSFANSLTDTRYADFAKAYNFSGDLAKAQTSAQTENLVTAYQDSFTQEETDIKSEVSYFQSKIGSIDHVNDIIGNDRLRTYVLESFGLDAKYTSKNYLSQVLTSDLNDPDSVANQASNDAWRELAAAFNFSSDGTVAAGETAQSAEQTSDLRLDYIYNKSTYPSDLLLDANQSYWEKHVAEAGSASEITSDARLLEYVKTAFGLRDTMMASSVASMMYSRTFAETIGNTELLDYFSFQTDGTVAAGGSAQTSEQATNLEAKYKTAFQASQADAVENAVSNFETRIADVKSIDDFFKSNADDDDANNDDVTEIWDVALRAFGIDPSEVKMTALRKILSSNLEDKDSYANQLDDERYVALVKAFNFDTKGDVDTPLLAQSENVTQDFTADYLSLKTRFLKGDEREKAGETATDEIEYFEKKMESISTVDELLSDSRLVNFLLESQEIDPKSVTKDELQQMFASDLDDPKSYVNQLDNKSFAKIVASFNFDTEGNLTSDTLGTVQQRGDVFQTVSNYYRQTLEEEQGDSNEGVRLALYFERKASSITSAYDILGDSALLNFFKTAYNLSTYFSSQELEKQAATVEKFVELDKLSDPDYVQKVIQRFTALYDSQNGATDSAALSILQGSSSSISADTLLAVAQLSAR
ncbi:MULTISPECIES: DUF1217 domain-containing protein [Rhizobiaceae]|uniref:DUF1217 domain-containing protein n=1 Tax=Aliirhizobium cellulosilyticum TaxID=393664 RepID=A0A7W6X9S3_9HYPH|nr:DUF1217 domain-containing protein [Rhizobium cellulosilyticum]MBB4348661.1 hypothetical protein [Rhizobium cellulosilyticum]MBB4411897.1 hypothetical protein [Rhizobium cellulosilyticum]MBB4446588.1 hypothetical protein [Rhizobium cellulosilyticum]